MAAERGLGGVTAKVLDGDRVEPADDETAHEPVEYLNPVDVYAKPRFFVGPCILPVGMVDRKVRLVLADVLVGRKPVRHERRSLPGPPHRPAPLPWLPCRASE